MKNERILTVDLGSSYTKVAIRSGWSSPARLVTDLSAAAMDSPAWFPSAVACVTRGGKEHWMIGIEAAAQVPGDGVRVFRNWKASLFAGPPVAGELSAQEARHVAVQFFRVLREGIDRSEAVAELLPLGIRVCVPKLVRASSPEEQMRGILKEAGWSVADGRATVFEPESNALGILSRGDNRTWTPRPLSNYPFRGRSPYLPAMIEPRLSAAFRAGALSANGGHYGVLVVDVGAYTTDFGYVAFDTGFTTDDWQNPPIVQLSVELGVFELDRAIRLRVSAKAQAAIAAAPIADWERLKVNLYRGVAIALSGPGGIVRIGEDEEATAIKDEISKFAERVSAARNAFVQGSVARKIHEETLTGGGTLIPGVRALLRANKAAADTLAIDLSDVEEPRRALGAGAAERALEARRSQNLELVRGGSAMGGCSVFFE